MTSERTLVIFKPDVIQRQIVGELLTRFERKGFKIVGMKMTQPTLELAGKHYTDDEAYLIEVGEKTKAFAKERGEETFDLSDYEVGALVRKWNMEYLSCGPVIAIVIEGPNVVEGVRKMIGKSNPILADVGTIRADYTPDSYLLANTQGRTSRTMVHASDSPENGKREIALWFNEDEIFSYETAIEKILFDIGWSSKQ